MAGDTGLKRGTARLSASLILAALFAFAISTAFLQPGAAGAQQSGVRIADLKCDTDPEVVQLTNGGTTGVNLTGWKLVSDPAGTETFDLTPVATLAAGASVFVESGPAATGAFKWSASQVFRDGDASDYARIVDNAGATVQQVVCPAMSPNGVPNGGGPPGDSSALTIGIVAAAAGGALVTTTAIFGLICMSAGTLLRRRRGKPEAEARSIETADAPSAPEPAVEAAETPSRPPRRRPEAAPPDPALWPYLVVVLVALAAALLLFMADSGKGRGE